MPDSASPAPPASAGLPASQRGRLVPWLRLAGTLFSLLLVVVLFRQEGQGWSEILQAVQRVSWQQVLIVFALTMVSRFAVAGRWHALLRSAGIPILASQTIRITFAGLFMSNFLPTTIGGDVVRLAGVLRLGYDRAISLASLVVDRLVGMAGMAMASLALLGYLPRLLPQFQDAADAALSHPLGPAPAAGLAAGASPVLARALSPVLARMQHILRRLWQAVLIWLRQPRALGVSLVFTWIHMLCVFGSLWVLLRAAGEPLDFWLIGGLWAVAYFITLIPVSINGLGLQEFSITFLYTRFAGVSASTSLLLALFMRFLPILASLPGALFIPDLLAGAEIQTARTVLDQSEE